jgi:hypothetical protein
MTRLLNEYICTSRSSANDLHDNSVLWNSFIRMVRIHVLTHLSQCFVQENNITQNTKRYMYIILKTGCVTHKGNTEHPHKQRKIGI